MPIPLAISRVENVPALRAKPSVSTLANHPVATPESLGLETANDVFFRLIESGREEALLRADSGGFWHPISTAEVYSRVRSLANVLLGWGIVKGDRVAILAENRWEWPITDFAVLAIGAVGVPIYPTQTGEQTAALLTDSGSRVAFVSTREQYEKLAAVRRRTPLERIVIMDNIAPEAGIDPGNLMRLVAKNAKRGAQFTPQGVLRFPLISSAPEEVLIEIRLLLDELASRQRVSA